MKRLFLCMVAVALSYAVFAALPPQHQNLKDLEVMVNFVKSHTVVAAELESINLEQKTIYFGDHCRAVFTRQAKKRPKGWVGPAEPLVFKSADCDIGQ